MEIRENMLPVLRPYGGKEEVEAFSWTGFSYESTRY